MDGRFRKWAECPGKIRSSMWSLGQIEHKGAPEKRTRTMERVYIYGYVSFALGVLFLLGLISFTWVALCQISNAPVW
jgi:hypothetical protein